LKLQVNALLAKDASTWETEYGCKPSFFIRSADSIFLPANLELAEREAEFIVASIGSDGLWEPNWQWSDYPEAWEVSKRWWKGGIAIKNLLFFRLMGLL
jgi:hypothetical protein